MKILIVGGGIAGCACAALLQKNGVGKVTVVEKAPEYRNIGYLIALWSTGRKVLKKLGIDEQIAKNGCEYEVDLILDKNGRLLKAIPIEDFKRLGPTIVIRRADLHTGLFKLLSGTDVRFNTTVGERGCGGCPEIISALATPSDIMEAASYVEYCPSLIPQSLLFLP